MLEPIAAALTVAPPTTVTTLFGAVIPAALDVNGHHWAADADGLYHTATDLKAEWSNFEAQMLAGKGATLTAVQRLEGNAEAVFDNTGLKHQSAANQLRDREDVQREYDAMGAAMASDGYDATKPFTEQSYLAMERTIQASATLQELGIQGHGLNNPPDLRYRGYTNDFQNNVDQKTLFVGGGLDNNERALADFFDDVVLSHAPFPTVFTNGHLEQLNQNGNDEDRLRRLGGRPLRRRVLPHSYGRRFQRREIDRQRRLRLARDRHLRSLACADRASRDGAHPDRPARLHDDRRRRTHLDRRQHRPLSHHDRPEVGVGRLLSHDGEGHGASLTAIERLEGNAEAVFENTGLSRQSAVNQVRDREDAQRELDAIDQAMRIDQAGLGISPTAEFTQASYLALEHTLQGNAALEQLAIQGHGLNGPPSTEYRGYTNDVQNNVDNTTKYVGGGLDQGKKAVADFFDDIIMTHTPFPVVFHNGRLEQYNQNGAAEDDLAPTIASLNAVAFRNVLVSADFSASAKAVGPVVSISHDPATTRSRPSRATRSRAR